MINCWVRYSIQKGEKEKKSNCTLPVPIEVGLTDSVGMVAEKRQNEGQNECLSSCLDRISYFLHWVLRPQSSRWWSMSPMWLWRMLPIPLLDPAYPYPWLENRNVLPSLLIFYVFVVNAHICHHRVPDSFSLSPLLTNGKKSMPIQSDCAQLIFSSSIRCEFVLLSDKTYCRCHCHRP